MTLQREQPVATHQHDVTPEPTACLDRAMEALLDLQREDGHWCAELEGDSILASEYVLMKWILEQEDDPRLPRILQHLRRQQRDDGGWGQFPGSGIDVSATVKAYVCLLLAGDEQATPHMVSAERAIRKHGGAEACNSFSNFYLAGLGLISWDACPAIPPEMIWFPRWLPFNLDHLSAWTRTMVMPLAICSALRPVRALRPTININHLFHDPRYRDSMSQRFDPQWLTLKNFFLVADRVLKYLQQHQAIPCRPNALRAAEEWILDRINPEYTEGLGAIFPSMVYLQIAFHALGYPRHHPPRRQTEADLDALMIDEPGADHIRIQPCFSPVWDTGIALYALTESGRSLANDPGGHVQRACDWLLAHENRLAGDWSRSIEAAPAGWYFEYSNQWYPDVDDTAMVAMALTRSGGDKNTAAARRGVAWILALQNDDGGWAAFDRTRDRPILEAVPFADHNAIQDPSCADITGRVLECLAWHGHTIDDAAVQRALRFLRETQEPDGCWFGRWGVNYIYGTWQVTNGLYRIGRDMNEPWIQRAGRWLKSIQKPDGGFGESADSYEDPGLKGIGPSTASQTAWAAMALQNICGPECPDLRRAIDWLCQTQLQSKVGERNIAGSWSEREFTGTGFPRVFYLRYHLYRLYFPVMALARYLGESA